MLDIMHPDTALTIAINLVERWYRERAADVIADAVALHLDQCAKGAAS